MTIKADGASCMEIVEQNVALGQRVLVRRDVTSINTELGIGVALCDIAKHLIVRAVFLDDEKNVPDAKRGQIRNSSGRLEAWAIGRPHFTQTGSHLCGSRS